MMMDKREIRRMKNRDSAVRSRQKKDQMIDDLRVKLDLCNGEIRQLQEANRVLRSEIPHLSERVVATEDSDFKRSMQLFLEPAMEDSCNKILVKKECVSSSSSVSGQSLTMSQSDFQREKRQVRAEIVRCKRAGVACDDELMMKKRRLDEACATYFPEVAPSTSPVEMDANKTRQLRNRESAERSRLKKDMLVDTLTYQVLQCRLQISDLKDENQWLREQKLVSSGCCASPYSVTTVSSGVTTCDEAEGSDSEDSYISRSRCSTNSTTDCSSPMANVHMYPTAPVNNMATMMMVSAPNSGCFGSNCYSYSYSSSSPVSGYSSQSEGDLLDDCADIIDTWLLEEGQFSF